MTACSNSVVKPRSYAVNDDKIYVPINLTVVTQENSSSFEMKAVNYIADSFKDSGLFAKVDLVDEKRWPYKVFVSYKLKDKKGTKEVANLMVSASTLMLVPNFVEEEHVVNIQVKIGDRVVKSASYTEKVNTAVSLYHQPEADRKVGINKIMKNFFAEVEAEKSLPKIKEVINAKPQELVVDSKVFL